MTRFIQLKQVEEGAGKPPPPVLVLHGHYGGCVGDLPSYDAFTLGGPYSVRGYNMGELGAARNILEVGITRKILLLNFFSFLMSEVTYVILMIRYKLCHPKTIYDLFLVLYETYGMGS